LVSKSRIERGLLHLALVAMYYQHFHLSGPPFQSASPKSALFLSPTHLEGLTTLEWGLSRELNGFTLLTGEAGTGKTTLIYSLLQRDFKQVRIAYIPDPKLSFLEILRVILAELNLYSTGSTKLDYLEALDRFLNLRNKGERVAIIVDESQVLSDDALEELRLLSNHGQRYDRCLQLILVGQPELVERLKKPELHQLNQRISARGVLNPLNIEESLRYVQCRLYAQGGASAQIFEPGALRRLLQHSDGIPRKINLLCHNAMLLAYSAGAKKVSLKAAKETAAEYDDSTRLSNQASSAPHPQKKPGLIASAMLADSARAKKNSLKTTEETAAECDDSPRMSNQASSAPRPQKKPALIAGATLASLLSLSFVYRHVSSGQSIKQTVLSGQAREQTVRPIQIVKQTADLGVRADPAAMPPPVTPLTPDPVERQPSPAAGAAVDEAPKGSIPGLVALPEMRIVPVLGPVPVSVASHEQTATPAPTERRRIITPVRNRPVVVSSGRCYMLLPPFFHGTPDTSAPLYRWKQSGEFRSAASCERFRRQAISDTVDERDEDTTKFKSLYDDRIKLFTVASCLSPRDPRMKEVQ
jgi:type II secretory pathway predicted ATPase ExeA